MNAPFAVTVLSRLSKYFTSTRPDNKFLPFKVNTGCHKNLDSVGNTTFSLTRHIFETGKSYLQDGLRFKGQT